MSTFLALFETSGIVDTITSVLGTILYPLFSIIFVVIGAVQHVFRVFAGVESASYDGKPIGSGQSGLEEDTGLLYHLLTRPLVRNMVMSIMILAFFLVLVFTVMAFFKNMYAAKQKGWKEIVGNSIKGIANFFFLPVCCLLGIWLGNILLDAIDGATSYGGATSMERKLFISCAYNANLYRTGNATGRDMALAVYTETYGASGAESAVPEGLTDEDYAKIVDDCYVQSDVMDIARVKSVGRHYSLWQINYIVLISGGIFMLYVLGSISFAMIKRLFMIIVLFIISPAICAMYPLDEGNAVKTWSGKVKGQVLSAYGAVAGMNIFFSIVPLIDKISLFGSGFYSGFGINDIVHLFIYVTGLLVVKDIISLISSLVGGDDAYGTGASLMKSSKDAIKKNAIRTTAVAGVFAKPIAGVAKHTFGVAKGAVGGLGRTATRLGNWAGNTRVGKKVGEWKSAAGEKIKGAGSKLANNRVTKSVSGFFKNTGKKISGLAHGIGNKASNAANWVKDSKFGRGVGTMGKWIGARASDFKNSEFVKSVGGAGKAAVQGAIGLGKIGLEAIGVTGFAKDMKEAFKGGMDKYDKAKDPQGADKVAKLLDKMDKEGLKLASESIDKMGSFADPYAKKLIGKGDTSFAKTMGLEKGDGAAEIKNIDKVLSKLQNYASRISESEGSVREELIKSAVKYAVETDSQGNEKVQTALNEALKVFSSEEIKVDGLKVDFLQGEMSVGEQKVKIDTGTIKEMTEASAHAFEDAVKGGFKAISKELAAEVAKEKAKDKK